MRAPRTLAARRLQVAAVAAALCALPDPSWTGMVPALVAPVRTAAAGLPDGTLSATVRLDLSDGRVAATLVTAVLR